MIPSRFNTAHPRLEISSFRDGPDVVIRVSDNGPGISPENLVKIREPLYTTKSFGTGLGVARRWKRSWNSMAAILRIDLDGGQGLAV
jgi:nitrogen fixation/metabolism regulation signal transduction histidine kinase